MRRLLKTPQRNFNKTLAIFARNRISRSPPQRFGAVEARFSPFRGGRILRYRLVTPKLKKFFNYSQNSLTTCG
jgi:hypothetical protein